MSLLRTEAFYFTMSLLRTEAFSFTISLLRTETFYFTMSLLRTETFYFTVILLTIGYRGGKAAHTQEKPTVGRSVLSKQIFIKENHSPFFQF